MVRKKSGKHIGILVNSQKHGRVILRNYKKYVPKGLRVYSFTPASINWAKKTVLGTCKTTHGYQVNRFPLPDVVYNRIYGVRPQLMKRIDKAIGSHRVFNDVTHFNKQTVYERLSNTDVVEHLPATAPFRAEELEGHLDLYSTVYLKPCLGYKGYGVYRLGVTETGEVNISEHHFGPMRICRERAHLREEVASLTGSKRYVIQQGISNMQIDGRNFDIRVLVQKNGSGTWNVTDIISRTAYAGYFNTSVCETVTPTAELLKTLISGESADTVLNTLSLISLQTANTLETRGGYHLGELSVDFVMDSEAKVWLIEINGDPQRTIYKSFPSHREVYRNPMLYAHRLLRQ